MVVGDNQRQMRILHFFQLISRNAGLHGKKEFFLYAISFCQHLAPTVLATGFDSQYRQVTNRKENVVIALTIRKEEVWLFVIFCYSLLFKE